ncbi:hypothetical protein O8B41_21340 [Agrobacterium rhizogenes]|uniref:Uncharacterized protein n=1 Tax=Agrobacterium cucumeris TaxID=2862866 RepID=A0ABY8RQD5_9HYPH|nr:MULTISPECIES: hypothetical protein [Rhizobium/Agrobacterium group]MCZ7471757.1 hypothetical protein [Rhizobium rhizogenes]WHO09855.1 hypothetical protein KZ699_15085 [Agrobacterium cucumeris]
MSFKKLRKVLSVNDMRRTGALGRHISLTAVTPINYRWGIVRPLGLIGKLIRLPIARSEIFVICGICHPLHRRQQKRPGQYCTDLPHIAFNTSASTSVVKSLKRLKQLRTTISFALTSSCHMSYIDGQCGQNKSGN